MKDKNVKQVMLGNSTNGRGRVIEESKEDNYA
jgi:hypothetical protein